jgi:hypothetical protein
VCDGFCDVLVPPSPKLHEYAYGVVPPLAVAVKETANGAGPEVGVAVPVTLRGAITVIVVLHWAVREAESVAVTLAVYVPAPAYVCDGFCNVLVPPSPNVHEYV